MRAHRFALTTLVLLAAVLATGCGSGRDASAFLPDAVPATASAPPAAGAVPQVVVAGPKQALVDERDAAAADAKASREAAAQAAADRKAARQELRKERARAKRLRKRAAARELALQTALLAETRKKSKRPVSSSQPATPKPEREPVSAPITGSDTGSGLIAERNRRSDAEARAAVVRFHELLDNQDVRSCEMLTDRLLSAFYGDENAMDRCREAAASISAAVSVVIAESRTYGKASSLAVVTRVGDQEFPQTMQMVLVNGSWLVDAVERRAAS